MAKKLLRLTVVAEMEIDTENYPDQSDDAITAYELENWQEWILDNPVEEKIEIIG